MRKNMIELRKKRNLTQSEVAEKLGVARNTYTSYETGDITPSLEIGIRIKQVLNTQEDNIFLNK